MYVSCVEFLFTVCLIQDRIRIIAHKNSKNKAFKLFCTFFHAQLSSSQNLVRELSSQTKLVTA